VIDWRLVVAVVVFSLVTVVVRKRDEWGHPLAVAAAVTAVVAGVVFLGIPLVK
jgi:hypothetical protein